MVEDEKGEKKERKETGGGGGGCGPQSKILPTPLPEQLHPSFHCSTYATCCISSYR